MSSSGRFVHGWASGGRSGWRTRERAPMLERCGRAAGGGRRRRRTSPPFWSFTLMLIGSPASCFTDLFSPVESSILLLGRCCRCSTGSDCCCTTAGHWLLLLSLLKVISGRDAPWRAKQRFSLKSSSRCPAPAVPSRRAGLPRAGLAHMHPNLQLRLGVSERHAGPLQAMAQTMGGCLWLLAALALVCASVLPQGTNGECLAMHRRAARARANHHDVRLRMVRH